MATPRIKFARMLMTGTPHKTGNEGGYSRLLVVRGQVTSHLRNRAQAVPNSGLGSLVLASKSDPSY
jgi:hypothetical protein